MNTEMEELYTLIGQSIADAIPEAWETAQVDVELKPGVITARAYYVRQGGDEQISFNIDFSTARHFKTLHQVMAEAPKGDWTSARLKIDRKGQFELSLAY